MNPFGTRGADELARLLDGSPTPLAGPGLLAVRLRGLGDELAAASGPRPEFRAALRTRLLAVATVQAAQAAQPAPVAVPAAVSWRERLSVAAAARRGSAVAAGALASVVAVSGVAVAGGQSLPGDPFYGVKRGIEALQLQTADGDVEEGTRHLELAGTRLREVRGLVLGRDEADAPAALSLASAAVLADGADAGLVRDTLADMDESTRDGRELLTAAYRERRALEPLTALSSFADRQAAGLEQLLPSLPSGSVAAARASLALVAEVGEQADELLAIGTCGASCDPTQVAPVLPPAVPEPGAAPGTAPQDEAPCSCATPTPQPAPSPSTGAQTATASPEPTPTRPAPSPSPSEDPRPTPSPSPTEDPLPLPVPLPSLPVPVPSVPLPVPSISLPPLPSLDLSADSPAAPVAPLEAPAPAPAPAPVVVPLATTPRS